MPTDEPASTVERGRLRYAATHGTDDVRGDAREQLGMERSSTRLPPAGGAPDPSGDQD